MEENTLTGSGDGSMDIVEGTLLGLPQAWSKSQRLKSPFIILEEILEELLKDVIHKGKHQIVERVIWQP